LRRQEEQRIADSTHQLSLYIKEIKKDPRYSKDYISLLQSLSNPKDFFFKEKSFFAEGVEGNCCHVTNTITMKKIIPDSGDHGNPSTLPHELTHALRSELLSELLPDPKQCDYSSYMKSMLQEELIAISSQNYGAAKILTNQGSNLNFITEAQGANLNKFLQCLRNPSSTLAEGFSNQDKEMLLEGALYSMVAQYVYQTSNSWWTHYTKYYNDTNNTNHAPPRDGFETPLLPPTLARLALEVFKQIPEDQRDEHPAWENWHTMTGINLATLKLAAAQTTWPTYQSEVLAVMPTNSKSLG
jgi:hypothetical protein